MKPLNKIMLLRLLAYTIIFLLGCKHTTEPPPNKASITLTLEDVSCTEAWMTLKLNEIQLPTSVVLKQNDVPRTTINLTTTDTLLYIDSLLPKQSYKFKAVLNKVTTPQPTSNELNVVTMDTTSHNFTWQSWTFGTIGSSSLYDVAIIDENNIWAVGEIMIADTSINGYTTYNAAHWNGSEWKLKRIPSIICGVGSTIYSAIYTIYAFSENNIFFSDGGEIIHFNGQNYSQDCSINPLLTGKINKLWGSSSRDLYAVGNGGNIAHWDGVKWRKIESGTDLNIYDIWGEYNNSKSNYEINLVAAQQYVGPERKILTIRNNAAEELSTLNISPGSIHGIWFKAGRKYFVVGNGIYTKQDIYDLNSWDDSLDDLTPYYTYAISASTLNNIFICGSYGELLHFSGASWRSFKNTPGFFDAEFFNVDVKDGLVAVVGQRFSSGFITIGKLQ